jgi:phosphonate transport system substrate-binding protein
MKKLKDIFFRRRDLLGRAILSSLLVMGVSCTSKKAEIGSEKNPIKLFFTPSVDAKVIEDNSKAFKEYLERVTPYKFSVSIPQSYVAVVEAFGTKRSDIAAMNTFGYILAHEKYGAEARITVLRHGQSTYQAQFLAPANSKISKVEDFAGKKIAFVDPVSTSGYLLPLKMLKDKKVEFKDSVFAGKHDNVVSMIYQGQVEGGATFYSPPHEGEIQDARRLVKTQYPDVEKKVKIVGLSDSIPNDPIIFRKDLPEEMKSRITEAFLSFVQTPEGQKAFEKIYSVTSLKKAADSDYDSVREMLKSLGKNATELMKK